MLPVFQDGIFVPLASRGSDPLVRILLKLGLVDYRCVLVGAMP